MIRLAALVFLWATVGQAQVLDFPAEAALQTTQTSPLDSYDIPVGIWSDGGLPVTSVEGAITREAWRISTQTLTTLQMLRPLREQLQGTGFQVLFECQTEACGGFDFRFATETLPPPQMQINLGDFRFLSAERTTPDGVVHVTLMVSRTPQAGFVQVTTVSGVTTTAPTERVPTMASGLALQLETAGRAVLSDLTFATGSAQLAARQFQSLADVAQYLESFPDRSIALVGHTDAAGTLDANIVLSRQRALSVLERLVDDHGADRRQMAAEGMGYLAPAATNLTPAGREANRRVEVIVTSTQ